VSHHRARDRRVRGRALRLRTPQGTGKADSRNELERLERLISGPRPPHTRAEDAAWQRRRAAQETGETCGRCGKAWAAPLPVWKARVRVYRTNFVTNVCEACRPKRWDWWRGEWFDTVCRGCGRTVHSWRRMRGIPVHVTRYCSKLCLCRAQADRRRKDAQPQRCACGEMFTPTRSDARHCSNACRQAAYRKRCAS